ncbi:insulin-like growth factor-binding protein complex acid labile subunit [Pectinophora gossypiella]|uniref:insulin-like growth factor-binding protein complex acid labile subunit n=1 Tax=Pectinophora gossypiella TaxID=13191 RepID=UPI00214EBF01|nr:insulin-like growth factor-binding protein complex acid labile subunit [Pectinophora gossypiella]
MERIWQVAVVTAIILGVDALPVCEFEEETATTTCSAGGQDNILKRGVVSDNNMTTTVILKSCRITKIELESFNGLFHLKNLDLSNNKLRNLKLGVLDGAPEVTHLNLAFNLLTELPMGIFDQKQKLELLDLKGNKLVDIQLGLFDALTRLGHLDLSSNAFLGRDINPFIFDGSTAITFMDFSGSDMSEAADNLLHAFRILRFLNLSGCSLYEVPKFATTSNLRAMKHLMLINNHISKIEDQATFKALINLEILNFAGNSIELLHKDVFRSLTKLTTVVLSGNNLRSIPDTLFEDLRKLTEVDLSQNQIEFVPVKAFRGTALKTLDLSNNRFTYLSVNFILELSNSGLNRFNFDRNPWQCACLRDILKEAKAMRIEYSSHRYNGKYKECVTTKEFRCKRQPDINRLFVNMYYNNRS